MAGLGHAQDTATPGGVYLQGQLVTDSGLAAHHVYIGEAGRLPGARTTHCYLRPRSEMDFFSSPSNELLRASAGRMCTRASAARYMGDSPPFQLDRGGVLGSTP